MPSRLSAVALDNPAKVRDFPQRTQKKRAKRRSDTSTTRLGKCLRSTNVDFFIFNCWHYVGVNVSYWILFVSRWSFFFFFFSRCRVKCERWVGVTLCVLRDVFTPFNLINETMSAEKFNAKCLQFYEWVRQRRVRLNLVRRQWERIKSG